MSGWTLGIDFGTSYTVAAISDQNGARPVDVESNGRDRMPSSVFLTQDDEILVGTAAQHQSKFAPDRYEPTPKRTLGEGEVFLGDRLVAVEDLVGAVLRRVYTEACRQQGEQAPELLRLTYPADWAGPRRKVLIESSARAGMPEPELVPEPVAAAVRIALQVTPPDHHIAVYDFGGGTFDAAVLLRTADGFEVAGPPAGRDPLGGEDIDQRIIAHLGELLSPEHPDEWAKLMDPPDAEWRGLATELHDEVQRAKETLSDVKAAQLWIPGVKRDVQLTRDELNQLIGGDIEATIDALEVALRDASVTPNDLAGLYLVGGSSRIPLVADMLWRRIGVQPAVQDNPKVVVATGAATWTRTAPQPVAAQPEGTRFSGRLVARSSSSAWGGSCRWSAQMIVDRPFGEPLTLRIRDDPADGADTATLASTTRARRLARTSGFEDQGTRSAAVLGVAEGLERHFVMSVHGQPLEMFEQYLVLGDRALVLVCPEAGRAVAATATIAQEDPGESVRPRFGVIVPPEWTVSEQLTLCQHGGSRSLSTERVQMPPSSSAAWQRNEFEQLRRLPQARSVNRTAATLMNAIPGEVVTVVWRQGATQMITRLGAGVRDGEGISLMIALPHPDQGLFPELARSVSLTDAGTAG